MCLLNDFVRRRKSYTAAILLLYDNKLNYLTCSDDFLPGMFCMRMRVHLFCGELTVEYTSFDRFVFFFIRHNEQERKKIHSSRLLISLYIRIRILL